MSQDETSDHHRIIPQSVELWVGKTENDSQNGGTDVPEEHWPEDRNLPVSAATDDLVQVAAQLVALE